MPGVLGIYADTEERITACKPCAKRYQLRAFVGILEGIGLCNFCGEPGRRRTDLPWGSAPNSRRINGMEITILAAFIRH